MEAGACQAVVGRLIGHPKFAETFKHPIKFDPASGDFVQTRLSEEEQAAQLQEESYIHTTRRHPVGLSGLIS